MVLSKEELGRISRQIVKSMRIGRRYNSEGIKKAQKKFPWIERFIKKYGGKVINPKNIKDFKLTEDVIKELTHPKYGPLLGRRGKGDKFLVRDKIGESVRIVYHPENWELARALIIEIVRNGAHPSWIPYSNSLEKEIMENSTKESLEEFTPFSEASANNLDVRIRIEDDEDPEWKKGIPTWKFQIGRDVSQYLMELMDKRKQRWLVLGWPFKSVARYYKKPFSWYSRMLFDSLKESFSARTLKTAEYYWKNLLGKNNIRIVAEDGTDLFLSIKGRKILKDIGRITDEMLKTGDLGLNLPSGEVFCAPIENSANGFIIFEKIFIPGHGFVEGLELTFKGGKITNFKAKKNGDKFEKFLKENTESTKTIAELGIGCNRKAAFSGYILTDEKIFGTIHIAIGNNTGAYGGKNKASAHLDMVKDMIKSKGSLYVDGKLVMDRGKPLLQN